MSLNSCAIYQSAVLECCNNIIFLVVLPIGGAETRQKGTMIKISHTTTLEHSDFTFHSVCRGFNFSVTANFRHIPLEIIKRSFQCTEQMVGPTQGHSTHTHASSGNSLPTGATKDLLQNERSGGDTKFSLDSGSGTDSFLKRTTDGAEAQLRTDPSCDLRGGQSKIIMLRVA